MPPVKTRDGLGKKHEPYPLNEFPPSVIEEIAKRFVHLMACGFADITGGLFDQFFAEAIGGDSFQKPIGLADVAWNGCCWSVKTVQHDNPFRARKVRLIVGRNAPSYSVQIDDPFEDIQATGKAVLDIYNKRIEKAVWEHSDTRRIVLVRNFAAREFVIYERPILYLIPDEYTWRLNKNRNFEGFRDGRHIFTWQHHGSQFTIKEGIPSTATQFRIKRSPALIPRTQVLQLAKYEPEWVEIMKEEK